MTPTDLRASLVLRRDHAAIGNESALRREIAEGRLTRIAAGVFAPTTLWGALDTDGRYRLIVHAASLRYPDEVFSHHSAAALHRLPIIGAWPRLAESTVALASGGRSCSGLVRRAVGMPGVTEVVEGVRVTALARTVADAARVSTFAAGVAFADHALRTLSREALNIALDETASGRGSARAGHVVEFADARAESAGESLSRVGIEMLGFQRPVLQQGFSDSAGYIGRVDFFWPDVSVIGEFDGHGKYLRQELRGGRSPAQVVVDEKRREDRLRRLVRGVVRWEWADALSPRRLELILGEAGVQRRRTG